MKNQSFRHRFGFASSGIMAAARGEASFRTQLWIGLGGALLLAALRPPLIWCILCLMCAAAVLALELMNTCLEHLADRLHPERHAAIQLAKDCSAGAVLLASIAAALVGAVTIGVALGWLKG